jgi:hypothetical protein
MGSNTMGWDESWQATSGFVNIMDGNLPPDTQGRHIETEADFAPLEIYRFRYLKETWLDDGNPYWMGFVFQRLDDGTISSWGGLSLMMDDTELLFMGSPWLQNKIGIDCMGIQLSTEVPDTVMTWMVMKLDMDGTAERDSIFLWIDPDPSVEPDTKMAACRGDWNGSNGFNRIRLGNDAQYVLAYDGIRLGPSFDAVKLTPTSVEGPSRKTTPIRSIRPQPSPIRWKKLHRSLWKFTAFWGTRCAPLNGKSRQQAVIRCYGMAWTTPGDPWQAACTSTV